MDLWAKEQICTWIIPGSLSKEVFERRTSTGSESFSLSICLDATDLYCWLFFTLIETICPNIWSKSQLTTAKSSLPAVDVHHSKTIRHIFEVYFTTTTWNATFYEGPKHTTGWRVFLSVFDHGYSPQASIPRRIRSLVTNWVGLNNRALIALCANSYLSDVFTAVFVVVVCTCRVECNNNNDTEPDFCFIISGYQKRSNWQ